MKKIILEIILSVLFVFLSTYFVYTRLVGLEFFWNAQTLWSMALAICWVIVALGYYHQGWLIRSKNKANAVSIILPIAVFIVQCILFVKGIYYHDWSLIWGAVVVNSGVVFSLSQIIRVRNRQKDR
ncbi:MAG: hypothetical protein Q7R93_01920 [bacterium]|nr:hypothetical protein [bacterium]